MWEKIGMNGKFNYFQSHLKNMLSILFLHICHMLNLVTEGVMKCYIVSQILFDLFK